MLTQKDLEKAAETDDIEDLQHKSNNMKQANTEEEDTDGSDEEKEEKKQPKSTRG